MNFKLLSSFLLLIGTTQAGILLGKNGLIHEAAKTIGIGNLVNLDADARVNVLGNEVGVDGAIGVGEQGIGAHASADADVLGQKAKVHADVLDGHKVDQHNHEVLRDSLNRQYVLQRQYIGSQSVLVRKYLDNGQIYVDGANNDNVLQHQQVDESRMYDSEGGWWDIKTRKYYNSLGQWISTRVWDPRLLTKDVKIIYDKEGGWWDRTTGKYYNRLGQWISGKVYEDSQYPNHMQNKYIIRQGRIYDVTGGWWDLDGRYYNPSGQWLRGKYWNQELWRLAQSLGGKQQWNQHLWEQQQQQQQWNQQQQQKYIIREGRIYDVTGGWWELDGRYYNPSGQWLRGRYWDQELWRLAQSLGGQQQWNQHLWEQQQQQWNQQQQQKYIIREGRIYDVTGGWWELDGRYYNPSGQWLRGRYWDQELWRLAQSLGGQQQWNQHLWEQQQQQWNQQQQQKYIIREGRIYDVTGGWWELDGRYYNPSGQWLRGRYWDQELWRLAQSLGGQQQWNQHLWEQQQQQWNQQQQQKYIIREGRIYDVTGGWWELDGKYYNPSGQWLSGRYWNQELWRLAQSLGGKQQWNQQLWEQQQQWNQQHQGHWNQQQQQGNQQDDQEQDQQQDQQQQQQWEQQQQNQEQDQQQQNKQELEQWEQQEQILVDKQPLVNLKKNAAVDIVPVPVVSSLPLATSYDRDATLIMRPQDDDRLDTLFVKRNLESRDGYIRNIDSTVNLPSVPLIATSRDIDASVKIPLLSQNDVLMNKDSTIHVANLPSVPLVATSRDIDASVKIPLLSQNDVLMNKDSTAHVANLMNRQDNSDTSSDDEESLEMQVRPEEDERLDSLPEMKKRLLVVTSRDRDASVKIPLLSQNDVLMNRDSTVHIDNLPSVPLVATSRDIDASVKIPLLSQNDVLMNRDSTVHIANLPSVPLVATSRDIDASVKIPLLSQNDVLMNRDSTVHIANLMNRQDNSDTSSDDEESLEMQVRPEEDERLDSLPEMKKRLLVATSRDIDASVKIPLLSQNDVLMNKDSTVHVANLPSVPLTATSRDRDASVNIHFWPQDNAPKNVDSTVHVANLPSIPLIATSRDRDASVKIPLLSQNDVLMNKDSTVHSLEMQVRPQEDERLHSLPEMKKSLLVATSRDPLREMQQLFSSAGSNGNIRMVTEENGKALKLENVDEGTLEMQVRPEEDERLDSLPEMKNRLLVATSRDRDDSVNIHILPHDDTPRNVDSTVQIISLPARPHVALSSDKNVAVLMNRQDNSQEMSNDDEESLEMQVRPEDDERLDTLLEIKKSLLSAISKDPRRRMQQLVTSTGSDGNIRMVMGENGKALKLQNVDEESLDMQVRPEEDETLDSLPEMKKRVLVTVSKDPRIRMQQLVTSTGSNGNIRMLMRQNGKSPLLENVDEESLDMRVRPEEDERLDSLPEMKKRLLVATSRVPRRRMQQLVTSTGSDGNIRMIMGPNGKALKLENANEEVIEEPSNGRWVVTQTRVTSQNGQRHVRSQPGLTMATIKRTPRMAYKNLM